MKLILNSVAPNVCPHCGAVLDDENIYCGSCGADLTKKESERAPDSRLIKHRPKGIDTRDDILDNTKPSRKLGRFTPGSEDSGKFDSTTFDVATYNKPINTNARIGIILGIVGMLINIFYIVTLVGLNFVKRAEINDEYIVSIQLAKTLLLIQFIEQTAIYLGGIIYLIYTLAIAT